MTDKQFNIASKLLDKILENHWINERDHDHLLFILEQIYEEENYEFAKRRLDYLETWPRENGYKILKTIGFQL
jgi:hypothetical protein